uniref:Uncharacterized protein n=1 Tax=Arundo donax TaxID=35708 RepID=A0A0A9ENA8_ARUDO
MNRCQTYQRRQRGILCLFRYSIRCLCAVPRRHQRVIEWPHSLYVCQSFVQFFFWMPVMYANIRSLVPDVSSATTSESSSATTPES